MSRVISYRNNPNSKGSFFYLVVGKIKSFELPGSNNRNINITVEDVMVPNPKLGKYENKGTTLFQFYPKTSGGMKREGFQHLKKYLEAGTLGVGSVCLINCGDFKPHPSKSRGRIKAPKTSLAYDVYANAFGVNINNMYEIQGPDGNKNVSIILGYACDWDVLKHPNRILVETSRAKTKAQREKHPEFDENGKEIRFRTIKIPVQMSPKTFKRVAANITDAEGNIKPGAFIGASAKLKKDAEGLFLEATAAEGICMIFKEEAVNHDSSGNFDLYDEL